MQAKHLLRNLECRFEVRGRLHTATVVYMGEGRSAKVCVKTDDDTYHHIAPAKLWPMPGAIVGGWETTGEQIVAPRAVAGVRINRRRMVERSCRTNVRRITDACGRVHVGESPLATVRAVYAAAGKRSLRDCPPAFRRGIVHLILSCRAANLAEYRAVMGHAPLPTEAQITAAMLACR